MAGKSLVWDFFEKLPNTEFAKCLTCKNDVKCKNNTSNLASHLKSKHPNQYTEFCKKKSGKSIELQTSDSEPEDR